MIRVSERTANMNFYPRPPRGGRHAGVCDPALHVVISIHALREEGDCLFGRAFDFLQNFYPRPPRGGRREILGRFCILYDISIHALREEGDVPCL